MSVPTTEQMQALEGLIDAHGLAEVLIALAVICGDKAAHIRASYSDHRTARLWDAQHNRLLRLSENWTLD